MTTLLAGVGLHTGAEVEVRLTRHDGPTTLKQGQELAELDELRVEHTDAGVCVTRASGTLSVDLVEHLFAALSVLHAERGVLVDVVGPELPLLDGASLEWFQALLELGVLPGKPRQRVGRQGRYEIDGSLYEFEPGDGVELHVLMDYGPVLGEQRASYHGDLEQFRTEIAGARTFGFLKDREKLQNSGRAAAVDPSRVLVFDNDGKLAFPTRPPHPAELARHKLLDLCGDLFLHGGVPWGRILALRPGHTQTHAVLKQALADGVLTPTE